MRIATMMLSLLLLLSGLSAPVFAQYEFQTHQNQKTDIPQNARYEFIESNILARDTFKFDRFTGDTYILAMRSDSTFTWDKMERLRNSQDYGQVKGKVNYQMSLSGIVARDTYLMNVRTGATWMLSQDTKTGELFWDPIQ
jgi:hypothetical protein